MVENEFDFPIGDELKQILVIEDEDLGGDELCLDQVQLIFEDKQICLTPLADTDEIEVEIKNLDQHISDSTPNWGKGFLGKKLQNVWICENDQGYRDQASFAFGTLNPSLIFTVAGSVIGVCQSQAVRSSRNGSIMSRMGMTREEALAYLQSLKNNVAD